MLIGGHVSSSGGLARALERAEALGCEAMQIFNQSPRAWRPTRHKPDDIDAFKEARRTSPVAVVLIHAVYLINCASNDAEIRNKSLASLTHALCVGDAIEADGVVVHPGSAGKTVEAGVAMKRIGGAFKSALANSDHCPLLLENTAGGGATIGRNFDELADLIERVRDGGRVAVCLDSCHLHVSGHEIRDRESLASVVDDFDHVVGLDRLRCLHLNDSKTAFGSNSDRHANLGEGVLGTDGVRTFLGEPRFEGLPVVLEVPGPDGHGPDKGQIDTAKRLRAEALAAS